MQVQEEEEKKIFLCGVHLARCQVPVDMEKGGRRPHMSDILVDREDALVGWGNT